MSLGGCGGGGGVDKGRGDVQKGARRGGGGGMVENMPSWLGCELHTLHSK